MTEQSTIAKHLPHAFPFLLSASTVTLLVASNPNEGIVAENLKVPLALALLTVCIVWAVSALFTRDRLRQSLATTVIVLPTLLSGYVGAILPTTLGPTTGAGLEVALTMMLIGIGLYALRRVQWPTATSRFLNLFGFLLLLISLPAVSRAVAAPVFPSPEPTALPDTAGLGRPDIYFILLDAYTGKKSLRDNYEFDNQPFIDSLRAHGFATPDAFHSNYIKTFLSLGSMLSRQYFDDLVVAAAPQYKDRTAAYSRMEFNRTAIDLKRLGYSFYYVGSSYPPLANNRLADEQYSDRPSRVFELLYLDQTVLPRVAVLCQAADLCHGAEMPFQPDDAGGTEARIKYLRSLVGRPGPKFIFAHWLLPHGPYRFGPDCEAREPRWTVGDHAIEEDATLRKLYVDQLICTNAKLESLIDMIEGQPGPAPVIILQADHGNGRFIHGVPLDLADATRSQVAERFDAFGAYFGPAGVGDSLAAQKSPVNIFRALFRVMWGVDEPPLEDRHYWSDSEQSLRLTPVTLP